MSAVTFSTVKRFSLPSQKPSRLYFFRYCGHFRFVRSINLNHLPGVFLTFSIFISVFGLGIATQRPGFLLLNKIARSVLGYLLTCKEQMLRVQGQSDLFTQTIHWGRFMCTVWQEEDWGLGFLMMLTCLEVPIQTHADWKLYCLLITCWIEKEAWYSEVISARHMLKTSEVVRQMKLQRRDAKVHQHCMQGWGEGGMVHAATHSEFHMLLLLLQPETPENSHLLYFPNQRWEFSLLRRPPGEERAGQKKWQSTGTEFSVNSAESLYLGIFRTSLDKDLSNLV